MNLRTVLGWLAVAFVVWWIIEDPSGAAHVVHNIGTFLTSAAHGISTFFASLSGGNSGLPWWVILLIALGGLSIILGTIIALTHINKTT